MLFLRPPLRKVALTSALIYGVTTTIELLLPANLYTDRVSWLWEPWLGAYVYTFDHASLAEAALSLGLGGIFVICIAFYLDHCVVDQPMWAIVGGWAPMVSGVTLLQLQIAFSTWWVNIDIDHSGFQLAYCELVVGSAIVGVSWLLAPELLNPRMRRLWVALILGVMAVPPIAESVLGRSDAWTLASGALLIAIFLAGSRSELRLAWVRRHSASRESTEELDGTAASDPGR